MSAQKERIRENQAESLKMDGAGAGRAGVCC